MNYDSMCETCSSKYDCSSYQDDIMKQAEEAAKKLMETLTQIMREELIRDIETTLGKVDQALHVLIASGGLTEQQVAELRIAESFTYSATNAMERVVKSLPTF